MKGSALTEEIKGRVNALAVEKKVTGLAYRELKEVSYGRAPSPVVAGGEVAIGNGRVIPEVNFTLPPMVLSDDTFPEIRKRYQQMVDRILKRAVQLNQEFIVLELEHLYEMTRHPQWGALLTQDIKEVMGQYRQRYGVKSALRVTVADIRDQDRPPRMRSGRGTETIVESFRLCADAGADILSIESTGGKEVSDRALTEGNLSAFLYAVGVLGPADVDFLWSEIVSIANSRRILPGGDTACGFANTAMQLAHQNLIPKVMAAVARLASVPRSLRAVLVGGKGPLKDCGYENPIIKILTGVPISMEGKSSACAHSSPLGNISAFACDLWSNESVSDVRLLGGFAPEVFTEILIYDCRLMNAALQIGCSDHLQEVLVASDRSRDPQALMLDPSVMWQAAERVVRTGPDPFRQTVELTRFALATLREADSQKEIVLDERERRWLSRLEEEADQLPETADCLRDELDEEYASLFIPSEYGLATETR